MEEQTVKLREGLSKLYQAQVMGIIILLCSILVMIPVLGILVAVAVLVAALVAAVLNIMGLVKLGKVSGQYTTVLVLTIVNFVLGLFDTSLTDAISGVLNFICLWLVVKTTNEFLQQIGRGDVADKGRGVILCNLAVTAISVGCILLAFFVPLAAIVLLMVNALVALLGLVLYLGYLKKASQAF